MNFNEESVDYNIFKDIEYVKNKRLNTDNDLSCNSGGVLIDSDEDNEKKPKIKNQFSERKLLK